MKNKEDAVVGRYELKYPISLSLFLSLKKELVGRAFLDSFSLKGNNNGYFIRSLYYDDAVYSAYIEKLHGERNRIKLRFRSYTTKEENASFISVELKTRQGEQVIKHASKTSIENVRHFLKTRHFMNLDSQVLVEAERLTHLRILEPKLLVDYRRLAYIPYDDKRIRITFDTRIKYSESKKLFPIKAIDRKKPFPEIILEIKYKSEIPNWLQDIARKYSLKPVPNSKYSNGIELTQKAIFLN